MHVPRIVQWAAAGLSEPPAATRLGPKYTLWEVREDADYTRYFLETEFGLSYRVSRTREVSPAAARRLLDGREA